MPMRIPGTPRWRLALRLFIAIVGATTTARAEDIDGVQPAAVDQPRVNLVLRRAPKGPVLSTKPNADGTFNIEAFLDPGASSVVLSPSTADQLSVSHEKHTTNETRFVDIGVGGQS